MGKVVQERFFKNKDYPWNGQPLFATVVQFKGEDDIESMTNWLENHQANLDRVSTYKKDLDHYQKMIDKGELDYRVASKGEEGAVQLNDLKHSYGWWKKWTAEEAAEYFGSWEKDDIVWFAINKGNSYTYQLILKEGDYVAILPGKAERFVNIGKEIFLPHCFDWEEITEKDVMEILKKEEHYRALSA